MPSSTSRLDTARPSVAACFVRLPLNLRAVVEEARRAPRPCFFSSAASDSPPPSRALLGARAARRGCRAGLLRRRRGAARECGSARAGRRASPSAQDPPRCDRGSAATSTSVSRSSISTLAERRGRRAQRGVYFGELLELAAREDHGRISGCRFALRQGVERRADAAHEPIGVREPVALCSQPLRLAIDECERFELGRLGSAVELDFALPLRARRAAVLELLEQGLPHCELLRHRRRQRCNVLVRHRGERVGCRSRAAIGERAGRGCRRAVHRAPSGPAGSRAGR